MRIRKKSDLGLFFFLRMRNPSFSKASPQLNSNKKTKYVGKLLMCVIVKDSYGEIIFWSALNTKPYSLKTKAGSDQFSRK